MYPFQWILARDIESKSSLENCLFASSKIDLKFNWLIRFNPDCPQTLLNGKSTPKILNFGNGGNGS